MSCIEPHDAFVLALLLLPVLAIILTLLINSD